MQQLDARIIRIIENAREGIPAAQDDCEAILTLSPHSAEAFAVRSAAGAISRKKTSNAGVIFGQIGVECSPCKADCSFCSFGESHTQMEPFVMDDEAIVQKARDFCRRGDLYGLWLMTMHDFDLDHYLHVVRLVRDNVPASTNLYSNVGDTSYEAFCKMREAGITGAYHICHIGEGVQTKLDPAMRMRTMENARRAGLDLLNAVEPIGPENTPAEIAAEIFKMKSTHPIQTGCMKRTAVPGTKFENSGEITHMQLSLAVAAQVLSIVDLDPFPWVGIHEPCEAGYFAGANLITAETGVNPRDTAAETSQSHGLDMNACRKALYEAGFTKLAKGDGTLVDLTPDYIANTCE